MLNKNQSKNKNQWKYALLLPLLIAFVATFNTKIVAQEKKTTEITITVIDLMIDKNSTDESLKNESAFFKTEHDIVLTFKGIKRNTDNEITAIKIEAKGKNLKAKFENEGTNPIHPIKISYNLEDKFLNISNISKVEKSYSYITTINSDDKHIGEPENEEEYIFVTTDGDKTTWTSKSKKDTTIVKKYIIKEGEHSWTDKNEGKNVKIEIIKKSDHKDKKLHKTKEIHIISDSDEDVEITEEKGNNIFIIKTDNDSDHKMSKKENLVVYNTEKGEPLYFANGKEITSEEMKKISPDTIEKMEVFKGEKAIEKYGEKAKNGVILLTTKKE